MARGIHRLTQLQVRRAKKRRWLCDGGGLYLQQGRAWIFRYKIAGRTRMMGLGPLALVDLAQARELALAARRQLYAGIDPLQSRASVRAAAAKTITFDDAVGRYLEAHQAAWRNPKHRQQWSNTLATYASPVIGKLSVDAIDTGLVMRVLEPIWTTKPETASRLRGRIESVLAWATVRQFRSGDNPARWTNHLEELLPSRREILPVEHFAALAYRDVPGLIAKLRERSGIVGRALEFLILTASRSGEVLGARWDEIGLAERVWTVPAERMKSRREHRVPLCDRALAILNEMKLYRRNGFVFPSERRENLGESPMRELLKRLGYKATIHGMRSTFRDWAGEQTNFAREVCEAALAHAIGNKVEQTYRRGDALEKRRRLMEAWADSCSRPVAQGATITKLHVGNLG